MCWIVLLYTESVRIEDGRLNINDLQPELLTEIVHQLDLKTQNKVRQVSKSWKEAAEDN